jgi:short-subunit dehydrogenase
VFITGASLGLGKSLVLKLAKKGAKLTLVARDLKRLEAVKTEAVRSSPFFPYDMINIESY